MTLTFMEAFVIFSLALWRLTSLLANESGPFAMFRKMRKCVLRLEKRFTLLHRFKLYEGYTCEWCLSIWLGTALCVLWYVAGSIIFLGLLPLASSTIVIVLKYVVQGLSK